MTPEQIREAVELAEGWRGRGNAFTSPLGRFVWCDDPDKEIIAALASQLKRQVNSIPDVEVIETKNSTSIEIDTDEYNWPGGPTVSGPEPDKNSILACTEFLRSRQ